jgi:hypothetical protein
VICQIDCQRSFFLCRRLHCDQIGIEFLGAKFRSGKDEDHLVYVKVSSLRVWQRAFEAPLLDQLAVRLGSSNLSSRERKYRQCQGQDRKPNQFNCHHLLCKHSLAVMRRPLWNSLSTTDHSRLAWLTMAVRPRPKPASPQYFPRLVPWLLAGAALQNNSVHGSSTALRPYRFRLRAAAISGHASPGNGSRTRDQMETSNDCYRLCPQRR